MTKAVVALGLVAPALTLAGASGCARQAGGSIASPACDDPQFLTDRAAFASGTATADQAVDVCGTVINVLSARYTRSGRHGYFVVRVNGVPIEVISNLDAMRGAPQTWPWVSPGDYVYVRGRYFYDSANRQGIDWTEGDAGRSWSRPGYVVVCDARGKACSSFD